MKTNIFLSSFVWLGTRLVIFIALLAALIGQVTYVAAAPPKNMLSVTVGSQSGALAYGTAGDVTFSVSVLRGSPNSTTPTSFTLSVTGLPAGATVVTPLPTTSFTFSSNPRIVTLTIHSNGSVAVGPDSFTVQATGSGPDPSGLGTLTISQATQTITFGALANKTFGDPPFNVSATGGASGNPVTFTASGNCTVAGTLVTLTGAGSCTITAAQAGNTNYAAAANVPQTFTITALGSGIHLYAVTGTASFPGLASPVTVWGYNTTNAPVSQPGGPLLVVNQNDVVTVTLHNNLAEYSGLLFQGQNMIPDTTGASAGGTKTYTFTAGQPGTYLYEAGLRLNSQHQVAMGLYGALVVRPTGFPLAAPGQAYGDASTAFGTEQVLVLSEFDTALTTLPNTPATFDMRKYAPKFFLINGKAYPNTASIPVTAGDNVLLRYVNAGLQSHAMSLLGFTQTVVATDGNAFTYSHKMSSETIAPGQTLDTIINVPASTGNGSQYPLYDANMLLRNNTGTGSSAGIGGMLALLTVGNVVSGPDTTGPLLSSLTLSPNPSDGTVSVALSFNANDTTTGNSNVTAAEYWIDAGAHTPITVGSPATVVTLNATIPSGLSAGTHVVSVRAQDALTNWSTTSTINLIVDNVGPTTSGLSLTPNPTNGNSNLSLATSGTATGGTTTTLADSVQAWTTGQWVNFQVRITGGTGSGQSRPITANTATSLTVAPVWTTPPDGTSLYVIEGVALSFTADDSASGNSNVTAAEYWIDSGAHQPVTVASPAPVKILNVTIPSVLSAGSHVIHARSQDALGNWGAEAPTINLVIDNTGPATTSVSATFNPNNGSKPLNTSVQAVRVSANFSDVLSGGANLSNAEGFLDVAGTTGTGFVFVADDGNFNSPSEAGFADIPLVVVNALSTGTHPICVHAKDVAGNWGAMNCATLLTIDRTPPTISSINRIGANPTNATSVQFLVTFSEAVTGLTSSNFTIVRTGLTGTSTITSVVDGGATWTVTVTTGTGSGTIGINLTSATGITDLAGNALSSAGLPFVGQTFTVLPPPQPSLYFSTSGNTNPPGVSGTADDADIYLYNGSAFSRIIDLTAAPYSISGSNVDGFDRVSPTEFYMSFSGGTSVPGISGTVQDEDVVHYNAGSWSMFFDGSANSLGGTDLDAISIVGGTLYFSTDDSDVPTGVSGGGDDADIYSWNGTSFARVYDASALGWSTTNVDGFVWVDSTHFYISYSSDTTSVPGLSAGVQDEDVIYKNGSTWSVYFDGTVLGLTNTDHDIDAFDLP